MAVTNKQVLEAIQDLRDSELAEIKEKLDVFNGRQRETETKLAGLVQWRHDHEVSQQVVTAEIKGEVKSLRGRTNFVGAVLGLGQIVSATLGAIFLGNKGP